MKKRGPFSSKKKAKIARKNTKANLNRNKAGPAMNDTKTWDHSELLKTDQISPMNPGLYIPITFSENIDGKGWSVKSSGLVDSGAGNVYISKGLFETLGPNHKKLEELSQDFKATSATGSDLECIGVTNVCLKIGQNRFTCKAIVTKNLFLECIIGYKFLKKHKFSTDFNILTHTPSGDKIQIIDSNSAKRSIFCTQDYTFVPNKTQYVNCVSDKKSSLSTDYLFKPSAKLKNHSILSIVNISGKRMDSIYVVNQNNKPFTLKKAHLLVQYLP